MERTFAFGANKPKLTSHALYRYRTLLSHSPENAPYSWGFSFVKPNEELILKRRPMHLEGFNIYEPIEKNPVLFGIGNLETTEGSRPLNAIMPFRYHNWFFSMVGGSQRENTIKSWLSGTLPPFLKRNLKGHNEQDHVFHLFLSYLYDAGVINVYSYPLKTIANALARTYDTWQLFLSDAGIHDTRSAFTLTDGHMVMGCASHDNLMGYKYFHGDFTRCSYCRDSLNEEEEMTHEDLRALYVMADLERNTQEFGLTPLPKEKLICFDGKELAFLDK